MGVQTVFGSLRVLRLTCSPPVQLTLGQLLTHEKGNAPNLRDKCRFFLLGVKKVCLGSAAGLPDG